MRARRVAGPGSVASARGPALFSDHSPGRALGALAVVSLAVLLTPLVIMAQSPAGGTGHAPARLLGTFEDDYGNHFTITERDWVQNAASSYEILEWSPDGHFVIARNADDNPSDPGRWTRIDWVELEGMEPWSWAFCLSAYDADSAEAARAVTIADRSAPRTGCNGFPFSRMRRTD